MFTSLAAERASRLRGRRPARVAPDAGGPEPVPITRVTVIPADELADEAAAQQWLTRCRGKGEAGTAEIDAAVDHVNHAIAAYRVCASDAYAGYVSREQAARVRLGYGSGSQVVEGAWKDAYAIPHEHGGSRRARRKMLTPEQELAGILTGRRPPAQPSEELLLRARSDLDRGRMVEAALQTRAAADALAAELDGDAGAELPAAHGELAARLARAALQGNLGAEERSRLEQLVAELQRIVRRRRYAG